MSTSHEFMNGWKDRADTRETDARNAARKEVEEAKATAYKLSKKIHDDKEAGRKVSIKTLDEFENALRIANSLEKALETKLASGEAFVDEKTEYVGYFPMDPDFSIGDYCGRFEIDANRTGFAVDKYHDTDAAETVEEGAESTAHDLKEYIYRIHTDKAAALNFSDILGISESIENDDPEAINAAKINTHAKHFINAENKAIFETLLAAKNGVEIQAGGLIAAINGALCGKAKRGAEIWTNKTGFAALDVDDANGRPLIKRDENGNFIYKNKYIVREFANEILPNGEKGAPVIVGDLKNIVRFAVTTKRKLDKLDLYKCAVYSREIEKEIPILTTTDDEAFLNCYIAV